MAIQWHISDHFGSSLEGASGSVKAIVRPGVLLICGQQIFTDGFSLVVDSLKTLPKATALSFFPQYGATKHLTSKSSITSSIMLARFNLQRCQLENAFDVRRRKGTLNRKKRVRNHGVYPRFSDRVKNTLALPDKLLMLRGRETGAEACCSYDKKENFWEVNAHSEKMECSGHRYLVSEIPQVQFLQC